MSQWTFRTTAISEGLCFVDYIDNGDFNAKPSDSFNINRKFFFRFGGLSGCGRVPSRLPTTVLRPPTFIWMGRIVFNGLVTAGCRRPHLNTLRWARNRHGFPKCDELTQFFLFKSNSLMFYVTTKGWQTNKPKTAQRSCSSLVTFLATVSPNTHISSAEGCRQRLVIADSPSTPSWSSWTSRQQHLDVVVTRDSAAVRNKGLVSRCTSHPRPLRTNEPIMWSHLPSCSRSSWS